MDAKFPAIAAALSLAFAGAPALADDPVSDKDKKVDKQEKVGLKLGAALDAKFPVSELDGDATTLDEYVNVKGATVIHFMNLDALVKRAKQEKDEWIYETTQSTLSWDLIRLKTAMQRKAQSGDKSLSYVIVAVGDATYEGNLKGTISTYFDEHGMGDAAIVIANRAKIQDCLGLKTYPTTLILTGTSLQFCATGEGAPKETDKAEGVPINHVLVAVDQVARAERVTNPHGRGIVLASSPRDDATSGPRVGTAIDERWTLRSLTGEERKLGGLVDPQALTVIYFVPTSTLTGKTDAGETRTDLKGQDPGLHQRLLFLRETMAQAKDAKGKFRVNWVVVGTGPTDKIETDHAAQIQEYLKVHKVDATPLLDPKSQLSQVMNMPTRSLMVLDGRKVRFTWILDEEDTEAAETEGEPNFLVEALRQLQAGEALTNPYGSKGKERE